jgi:SAM-dependent methyltransferase
VAPPDEVVSRPGGPAGAGLGGGPFGPPDPGVPEASLHWDRRYAADEKMWGDGPSLLAQLTVARLRPYASPELRVLDVGCGYGRDTRYLATELGCHAVGIDGSPAAVEAARKEHNNAVRRSGKMDLDAEYLTADLAAFSAGPERAGAFDIVFACNVYHLLGPIGRREFAAACAAAARPGGLLFLSTLSPRDPEHYAKGEPVSGEERSWVDKVYLHFCTAEELERDFAGFDVIDLEERAYEEPRPGASPHHHTSWFLEGRRR